MESEILAVTNQLLSAIDKGDWSTYEALCDPDLTCFEPEAQGQLVSGLEFHRTYFSSHGTELKSTVCSPHFVPVGVDAWMIAYSRLVQVRQESGKFPTLQFEETRLWKKCDGQWKLVHLHRSKNGVAT